MKEKKTKKLQNFFNKQFSFERDIDLTDEVEVLFRRNIVIKNIIFVSNLIYSFILLVISLINPMEKGNWLFTVLPFPLTFMINRTIKKLIFHDKRELLRQQIAMYMCSFYMFLTAILLYLKLKTGVDSHVTHNFNEAGYILLYYSILVVSLYQNRRMLKQVFAWMLVIITIIHLTITYNITGAEYAGNILTFIKTFFATEEFADILLRTVIMGCFMLVVYIITVIGENMQETRNIELVKRQEIQDDFTDVVSNLFQVMMETRIGYSEDNEQIPLLGQMVEKLGSLYGLAPKKCEEIKEFSSYHVDHAIRFDFDKDKISKEEQFEQLRTQTAMGAQLVRRLQLSQKCENIIRAHVEGAQNDEFTRKMNQIQFNIPSQIILICDIYIGLRSVRNYKRPYNHTMTLNEMKHTFYIYFETELFQRFVKFASDFEDMFNQYQYAIDTKMIRRESIGEV